MRHIPPTHHFNHLKRYLNTGASHTGALQGKHALITGASRGIGLAIAQSFAREGARCTLISRSPEPLLAALKTLDPPSSGEHVMIAGDVGWRTCWDSEEFRRKTDDGVDVLVNAAGLTHFSPLMVTKTDLLKQVVNTNLMGAMYGSRVMAKMMLRQKAGCIINVASLLGMKGGKGSVGYAASKAGVIGMTRALAAELAGKNIRVNVIVPGYIETDMTAAMTDTARAAALDSIPLGRFGDPSEIADAAVFLATNGYANNCVLNLDGGLSAT